jgi:hypothetical protein
VSRIASLLGLAAALTWLTPMAARADVPQQLSVATAGACPSPEDVSAELEQLMPEVRLDVTSDVVDSDVIVADRGAGFTVKVRGQRRRFRDQKRDCTERARHVAVFTVLILDPLRVPSNASAAVEEEPEPAEKPGPAQPETPTIFVPPPQPRSPASFDLSLGPVAQVALRSDIESTTQAGGLGLRLRYGSGVGVSLGLAYLLPTSLHFRDAEARANWAPMDLSLSLSQRAGSWAVALDLGVTGALLIVEGEALDATQQAARLELGGRAGAQVRYWASDRAGIYFGLSGSYFPKPYSLQVEGLGTVGTTPTAWFGGSIGAVIRL